jgi:hypothetical protein
LIGDTAVGAVAFSVEPSAAALVDGSGLALGETGDSVDLEQATASARRAAADERTNLLWNIKYNLD